jgi:adenylate cyclase
MEKLNRVKENQTSDLTMDAELECKGEKVSVNAHTLTLVSIDKKHLGSMLVLEDISAEKRVKTTMARYMDPSVAESLLSAGAEFLGGQSLLATVLFCDIRDFTTLTESLGPQGTVSLLNEFFTIMVDCIQREGGMLDKFIGDAIMAGFGIPMTQGDDEDRAVRAAVNMIAELSVWNQKRIVECKIPVNIGIGVNTDTVVSGNIGSPKRMDFTMIGDGVNLASRLEGACKEYHTRILISDNTYKSLRGTYRSREVDTIVVKGKTKPISIYEILDYHTDESFPNIMDVLQHFKSGLAKYRQGKWDEASRAFQEAVALNPEDRVSHTYVQRCEYLRTHPPERGWDGVWRMSRK